MPRAYQLLVGVSEIDQGAAFYRENFPGYDGRRGCEGVARDIERMHGLTHYLGYEPLSPKPLVDERATRAGVLAALSTLGTPGFLQPNDIVFLYFTCHGRTVAEGRLKNPSQFIGNRINYLLLRDQPLFNFEVIDRLLRLPPGVRVFTLVDACHAGAGSNLQVDKGQFLQEAQNYLYQSLESRAGRDSQFKSRYVQAMGSPVVVIQGIGTTPSPAPSPTTITFSEYLDRVLKLYSGSSALTHQVAHFGAARDESKARGGPSGSLFTRVFYDLLVESGHTLTYHTFFNELRGRVPMAHPPVAEYFGVESRNGLRAKSTEDDILPPLPPHFAHREQVLQI